MTDDQPKTKAPILMTKPQDFLTIRPEDTPAEMIEELERQWKVAREVIDRNEELFRRLADL